MNDECTMSERETKTDLFSAQLLAFISIDTSKSLRKGKTSKDFRRKEKIMTGEALTKKK